MIPLYETFEDDVEIFHKKNLHVPPHLHKLLEFVYITEGTLELGLGQELYHMEQGDFAVVFPGLIHHTQVFCEGESRAVYLLSAPSCWEMYREQLLRSQPETPVIEKGIRRGGFSIPVGRLHSRTFYGAFEPECDGKGSLYQSIYTFQNVLADFSHEFQCLSE